MTRKKTFLFIYCSQFTDLQIEPRNQELDFYQKENHEMVAVVQRLLLAGMYTNKK